MQKNTKNNKVAERLSKQELEKKIKFCRLSLVSMPDDIKTLNECGKAFFVLGRYEEALEMFDQALKFNQTDIVLINNRANALIKLENYAESMKFYDIAFTLDKNSAMANKGIKINLKIYLLK